MNEKDRNSFLDTVGEMSERFDIDVFAYVLMDNHYHLLFRTPQANLKKEPLTPGGLIDAIFEAAICFRGAIKALSSKMGSTCCSLSVISIETN